MTIADRARTLYPAISGSAVLLVAALFSIFALGESARGSRAPQAPIKVSTTLVVLPVKVTDSHGQFVSGLQPENFKVFEDDLEQQVKLFKQEDAPVTVGLVVDHSRSMKLKLPAVALAVDAFAHSSNPDDEMFVVDFNENVSVELMGGNSFTHSPSELQKALYAVSADGQTALYDAVIEALTHINLGHWEKKALIVVSDGGDNASRAQFSDLLAFAQRSHVIVYCIGLVDQSGEEENPKILQKLSRTTGGTTYFTKRSDQAATLMNQIARDLREQYTVGYTPPKDGRDSFRKITVQVSRPNGTKLRVSTRPGYFASDPVASGVVSGKPR